MTRHEASPVPGMGRVTTCRYCGTTDPLSFTLSELQRARARCRECRREYDRARNASEERRETNRRYQRAYFLMRRDTMIRRWLQRMNDGKVHRFPVKLEPGLPAGLPPLDPKKPSRWERWWDVGAIWG